MSDIYDEYVKTQLPHEIAWLKNQLATKKLSQKNRDEYLRQIRRKELIAAFHKEGKANEQTK